MTHLNPAHLSKINWTQGIAAVASALVLFGIDLTTEQQLYAVTTIQGVQTMATWVFRTFFTGTTTIGLK